MLSQLRGMQPRLPADAFHVTEEGEIVILMLET